MSYYTLKSVDDGGLLPVNLKAIKFLADWFEETLTPNRRIARKLKAEGYYKALAKRHIELHRWAEVCMISRVNQVSDVIEYVREILCDEMERVSIPDSILKTATASLLCAKKPGAEWREKCHDAVQSAMARLKSSSEALTVAKCWPWKSKERSLREVSECLAPLVGKSVRTIRDWSANYQWAEGVRRQDDRSKSVSRRRVIATLQELRFLPRRTIPHDPIGKKSQN